MSLEETILSCRKSKKSFAELLAEVFNDKFIEIYIGDDYEQINTEQVSTSYPAVLCGKIIGASGKCLVINCAYVERDVIKLGNAVFINEDSIKLVNEVNGKGTLEDMFLRSKETLSTMKKLS